MSANAIEIKNLNKTYKASGKEAQGKIALKDVSLNIPKGSIFGLLGPNGAGKSTIINILSGLVIKTSGDVKVWDYDLDKDLRSAKAAIGIVPQEINYDPFFSPKDLLELQAGLYGVPKYKRRTMEILRIVGLEDKADAYTRSLSGGMRRRLMVAKAMVHSPPILVLDEPTAGVDVDLRKQLWNNVRELNRQGVTVILTTHYLEEAEELCDRIAIIHKGEIIADDDKDTLLGQIDNKQIIFKLNKQIQDIPSDLEPFIAEKVGDRSLSIRYSPAEQDVGMMIDILQKSGYGISDITTDDSDLEDVFLQLTK